MSLPFHSADNLFKQFELLTGILASGPAENII